MPKQGSPAHHTVQVVLDCEHVLIFKAAAPRKGEELFCFRCMAYRYARDAPEEFRIKCKTCRYSRTYGRAKLTAETKAAGHASRKSHTVEVWDGRTLVWTFGIGRGEDRLPLAVGDDPAPF